MAPINRRRRIILYEMKKKEKKGLKKNTRFQEISGYNENWPPRIISENGLGKENEKRKNIRETVIL
jgi:hypothetical protein